MMTLRFLHLIGIVVVMLIQAALTFGQDGSDMNYLKPDGLTKSQIGKWVHLDFGKRSFAAGHYGERNGDSVTVEIGGKPIVFVEHRFDDGLNNWFTQQYLETKDSFDGLKIRWVKNKLLSTDGDEIKVEAYFYYYTPTGNPYQDKSFTKEFSFKKDSIAEVLIWNRDR